jgi:NitT/TauT family transport system substrate-binding protein
MSSPSHSTPMRALARLAALLGVLALVAVAGCGGDDNNSSSSGDTGSSGDGAPPTVSIAMPIWIGDAPWILADEKGFDEDNGVNLDLQMVEQMSDITTSIGAQRIDAGYAVGPGQVLTMMQADIPFKLAMMGGISLGADQIIGGEGVSSVEDLRGKRVGVETASTGYPMLVYMLQEHGMTLDDIEIVELAGSQAAVALKADQVDAAYTWQPYINNAIKRGDTSLFRASEKRGIIGDFLVLSPDFAEDEETVDKVLATWQEAVEYFRSNPEESAAAIARGMRVPLDETKFSLGADQIEFLDLQQSIDLLENEWPDLSTLFIDIVNRAENAPRQVSEDEAAAAIDNSYAERVSGGGS